MTVRGQAGLLLVWCVVVRGDMACATLPDTDYYIPNQGPSGTAATVQDCCSFCNGKTPFFVFQSDGNQCYCKANKGKVSPSKGTTAGTCSEAPTPVPPPTPIQTTHNYQGCNTAKAKAFAYCNHALPPATRAALLVGNMTLAEKVSRMYSCVDTCDTCPCAVDRLGLPAYAYLLETRSFGVNRA